MNLICPNHSQPQSDPDDDILGCGKIFPYDPENDDGMVDCPHCGLCFDPRDGRNDPGGVPQLLDGPPGME